MTILHWPWACNCDVVPMLQMTCSIKGGSDQLWNFWSMSKQSRDPPPPHLGQFLWLASSFRHWWLAGRPGPSRRRWGGRFSFWRWSWGAWRGIRPGRWAPLETLPCRTARNPWVWGWEISLLHIEVEERGSCTSIHTLTWHFARQTRVRLGCRPCTYRNDAPLPGEHVCFIHLNGAEVLNGSCPNVRKLLVTQKDKIVWSVYSV